MYLIVRNVAEVICDNFMSQVSFNPDNPISEYMDYMFKTYFQLTENEKNDFNLNSPDSTDFCLRLRLYQFYISFFNDGEIENVTSQFDLKFLNDFNVMFQNGRVIDSIFEMIYLDDITLSIYNCCDDKDKKSFIKEYLNLNLGILSNENNDNDFKYSINLIEKLDSHKDHSEWLKKKDGYVISPVKNPLNLNGETHLKNAAFLSEFIDLENNNYNENDNVTVIFNFQDYFNWINSCNECKKENETVWFRGICNDTYNIIPSLFVNIGRMCETSPDIVNDIKPYAYQVSVIEQCYADTAKYSDIFMKYETPTANRQSVMQHYGAPTNLLDFSTDPYLSLYWALNPTKDDKNSLTTAVVYAFYVHEYFKTVNHIIELQGSKSDYNKFNKYLNAISSHSSLSDEYIIRDLSRSKTIEMLSSYENQLNGCHGNDCYDKTCELSKFPMPVVLPQTNRRINAQSGTFVAYNLLPMKDKTKSSSKEMFDYLALNKIQEYYIKLCESKGEEPKTPFLRKAIIPNLVKEDLNAVLSSCFNYSDKKVYPDLEVIFKNIDKNIVGYEL